MDTNLSKFQKMVMDREAWLCYSPWGRKESDTTEQLNWTELGPWREWLGKTGSPPSAAPSQGVKVKATVGGPSIKGWAGNIPSGNAACILTTVQLQCFYVRSSNTWKSWSLTEPLGAPLTLKVLPSWPRHKDEVKRFSSLLCQEDVLQKENSYLLHFLIFHACTQCFGYVVLFNTSDSPIRFLCFFKIFFFPLMWTVFKVFIEFLTILLLFYILLFWLGGTWDLSSLTRDRTCALCIGRQSLNYWATREVPNPVS